MGGMGCSRARQSPPCSVVAGEGWSSVQPLGLKRIFLELWQPRSCSAYTRVSARRRSARESAGAAPLPYGPVARLTGNLGAWLMR